MNQWKNKDNQNIISKTKSKNIFFYIKYFINSYPNAHLAQIEIGSIQKKEKEKFENEKEKRIEKELAKIKYKQDNEIQAMELKIENHRNQLFRERSNKINEIELKYKNKERDLERKQKAERESYERIISAKGRKKYSSRSMPKKY